MDTRYPEPLPPAGPLQANQWPTPRAGGRRPDRVAGTTRHLFLDLVDAGTKIGDVRDSAARHLGLKAGILVVAPGPTPSAASSQWALSHQDEVGVVTGTTASVMAVTSAPVLIPTSASGLVMPGQPLRAGEQRERWGRVPDWLAARGMATRRTPVAALCAEAATASPGAYGALSTAGAHLFDATALSLPGRCC